MTNVFANSVPGLHITDAKGNMDAVWYQFFVAIWLRTGGATGSVAIQLDSIDNNVGATLYRGATAWQGLSPGAQYTVLQMGVQFPDWGFLQGHNFGPQSQNYFLAGPSSGGVGTAAFRAINSADLDVLNGQYPGTTTNDNAGAGNIGQDISSAASAVSLTTATPKDITSISLSPGDWDVWGNFTSAPAGSTTQSDVRAWINTVSATDPGPPNGGCYAELQMAIAAGLSQTLPLGMMRVTIPTGPNLTVYLSAEVTFLVSTLTGGGFLGARRRR